MTPVMTAIRPDTKAASAARQPFLLSETSMAIHEMTPAPSEQSSHPHHGRSDGLIGTGEIVAARVHASPPSPSRWAV
jgi:hypothetical protein